MHTFDVLDTSWDAFAWPGMEKLLEGPAEEFECIERGLIELTLTDDAVDGPERPPWAVEAVRTLARSLQLDDEPEPVCPWATQAVCALGRVRRLRRAFSAWRLGEAAVPCDCQRQREAAAAIVLQRAGRQVGRASLRRELGSMRRALAESTVQLAFARAAEQYERERWALAHEREAAEVATLSAALASLTGRLHAAERALASEREERGAEREQLESQAAGLQAALDAEGAMRRLEVQRLEAERGMRLMIEKEGAHGEAWGGRGTHRTQRCGGSGCSSPRAPSPIAAVCGAGSACAGSSAACPSTHLIRLGDVAVECDPCEDGAGGGYELRKVSAAAATLEPAAMCRE